MRSGAVALVVAVVAVLAVLAWKARDDEGSVAMTSNAGASSEVLSIPGGGRACERVDEVSASFETLELSVIAKPGRSPVAAEIVRPSSGDVLARGVAEPATGAASLLVPLDRSVDAGGPARVCFANEGSKRIGLLGSPAGESTRRAGVQRTGPVAITFRGESRSLLDRIPDAFEHAELFKPEWMGAWTFWVLSGLVLLGSPALIAAGLWTTRTVGPGTPSDGDRFRRFVDEVEPTLLSRPRVHRFAAAPVLGGPDVRPAPLTVCLLPGEAGNDRTREALGAQTRSPEAIVPAPLTDALARAETDWVAVLDAGDAPAPLALERLGQAIALAPDADLITCDEDHLTGDGGRDRPVLRPAPSPDLLLARDLTSGLLCLRRDRALELAGPTALDEPGWRYRLALAAVRRGPAALAHVPLILCHRGGPSTPDAGVEAAAVGAWLDANGHSEARLEALAGGLRRVRRPLIPASVEAIVLLRDQPQLLRRCTRSLLGRSTHPQLRLRLVDNGSSDREVSELLAELSADERVTVVRDPRDFNFAALNNAAAAASEADFLLFLNNDTEVISPSWIEELQEEAQRPEVGAVAPVLLYPDGTVQHAGAALGMHGYAGHPFAGLQPEQPTPFGSAIDGTRNWLAVTAACMLVERRKFEEVGGFDESFVVAGNDVELCLRLTAAGYRSLCVPHVRLIHDESKSRGSHIDHGDFARSEERYGDFRTIGDPFYNPNLTLARSDCGLRGPEEL